MAKILFIGDVVGKPGRKILRQVLPQWKEKYQPDVTIVNVENLAHGKGVTPSTLAEVDELGVDCFTSGNHIFKKGDLSEECFKKYDKLIRPANFGDFLPGHGYYRFSKDIAPSSGRYTLSASDALGISPKGGEKYRKDYVATFPQGGKEIMNSATQQYLIINLNGTVFMEKQFDGTINNPFLAIDKLLVDQGQKGDIIIVDFHAEATSEKIAFGYYVGGRVAAVLGTHTHIPTADARVLTGGTAYITDVGMTGSRDGVIGVKKENVLAKFLDANAKFKNEPEEEGVLQINGVMIETLADVKAAKIEKLYREIN